MSTTHPLATAEPWNMVSAGYAEDFLLPLMSGYSDDAIERAELTPESTILDVATGPGTLALRAAPRVRRVVGVDFAEAMLAIAERRARELGIRNVEFQRADGQSLPFEGGRFDAAFSMFGLIFFPDRAEGLREMARVLRTGGRVVISSWTPAEESPLLTTLFAAVREALPELPFGKGGTPLSTPEAIRQELGDAGFDEIRVDRVSHAMEVPSIRAFWEAQVRSSAPITLLKSGMTEQEWEPVSAHVVERLETEFGTGPRSVGWSAFLGIGRRSGAVGTEAG